MMQATILTITDAIDDLVLSYKYDGYTERSINEGNCEAFAEEIASQGFGESHWGDCFERDMYGPDITEEAWNDYYEELVAPCHCFIVYEGRYYDSEAPNGVEWPDQLPCFKRLNDYWGSM